MNTQPVCKGNLSPQEWYDVIVDEIPASESLFTLPLVTWKKPTVISTAEKYQVCCIAYALLLSAAITTAEFEEASAHPDLWHEDVFEYPGECDETHKSLRLLVFYSSESDRILHAAKRKQIVRLVLVLLQMFEIELSYFIRVQQASEEKQSNSYGI